jgi:hypothetical protein
MVIKCCFILDYSNIGKNSDSLIILKKTASKVRFGKNENSISFDQKLDANVQLEVKGKIKLQFEFSKNVWPWSEKIPG